MTTNPVFQWLAANKRLRSMDKQRQAGDASIIDLNPHNLTGTVFQSYISAHPIKDYFIAGEYIFLPPTSNVVHNAQATQDLITESILRYVLRKPHNIGHHALFDGHAKCINFFGSFSYSGDLMSIVQQVPDYATAPVSSLVLEEAVAMTRRVSRQKSKIHTFLSAMTDAPSPYPEYAGIVRQGLEDVQKYVDSKTV